ncbi:Hypothetical predicted protein, partial [Pelobates cultripes]
MWSCLPAIQTKRWTTRWLTAANYKDICNSGHNETQATTLRFSYRDWMHTSGLSWKPRQQRPRCRHQAVNREANKRMAGGPRRKRHKHTQLTYVGRKTAKQTSYIHPPGRTARRRRTKQAATTPQQRHQRKPKTL